MKQLTLQEYVTDVQQQANLIRNGLIANFEEGTLALNVFDKTTLSLTFFGVHCDVRFAEFIHYFKEGKHLRTASLAIELYPDGEEYQQDPRYLLLRKKLLLSLFKLTNFMSCLKGWKPGHNNGGMVFNPNKKFVLDALELSLDYQKLLDEKDAGVISDYVLDCTHVLNNLLNSSIIANASFTGEDDLSGYHSDVDTKGFITDCWKESL